MRIILFLLSLAVCFLIGVLYGVDRDKDVVAETTFEQISEPVEETIVIEQPVETVEQVTVIQSGDNTPAYKAASALSSIVEFFYEIVVEVLFQISKLFY